MKVIGIQRMTQFIILAMFKVCTINFKTSSICQKTSQLVSKRVRVVVPRDFDPRIDLQRATSCETCSEISSTRGNSRKLTQKDSGLYRQKSHRIILYRYITVYHKVCHRKKGALNPSDLRCTVSTLHKQILNSPQRDGSARFTCRKG